MIAVLRRFFSWRNAGALAAFFAAITIFVRWHDPVFHTIVAAAAGALAALAAVMYVHEYLQPGDVWQPGPELTRLADRATPLARCAAALAAAISVDVAFIQPQLRTASAVPILLLTLFTYVQERLRPASEKEPA